MQSCNVPQAVLRRLLPVAAATLAWCAASAQAANVTATVGANGSALPGGAAQVRFDLDFDALSPVYAFQLDLLYDPGALDLQGFGVSYGGTTYSLGDLATQLNGLGNLTAAGPSGSGFTLAWESVFAPLPTPLPLLDGVATLSLDFTLTGLSAGQLAPVTLVYAAYDGEFNGLGPVASATASVTAQDNAVPEPASVALLLAGLGAVGMTTSAAARRRQAH
jgi:hypothetical protein